MSEPKPDSADEKSDKKSRPRYNLRKPLRQKLGKKSLRTQDYGLAGDERYLLEQRLRRARDRLRKSAELLKERRRCLVSLIIACALQMLVLAVQTQMMYDFMTDSNSRYKLSIRLSLLVLCLLVGCAGVAGKKPFGGALVAAVIYLTYLAFALLIHLEAGLVAILVQVVVLLFIGRAVLFGRKYTEMRAAKETALEREYQRSVEELEAGE